jgi:cell division septal protein FtsQ
MAEGNSEKRETDPAKLAEQLEIELMLKRASWQHTKARRGNLRMLSFAFVFLIVIGAVLGFLYFFSPENVQELKARSAELHASPSPTASPQIAR